MVAFSPERSRTIYSRWESKGINHYQHHTCRCRHFLKAGPTSSYLPAPILARTQRGPTSTQATDSQVYPRQSPRRACHHVRNVHRPPHVVETVCRQAALHAPRSRMPRTSEEYVKERKSALALPTSVWRSDSLGGVGYGCGDLGRVCVKMFTGLLMQVSGRPLRERLVKLLR